MVNDPFFAQNNFVAPGRKEAPKSAAPSLWKLSADMFPNVGSICVIVFFFLYSFWRRQVSSISLASNNLSTLHHIAVPALIQFLPNIRALSFENNRLADIRQLNSLSSHIGGKKGLDQLEELVLVGNPIRDNLEQKYENQYRTDVVRRFPTIRLLDQQPIDTPIVVPPKAPKAGPSRPPDRGNKAEKSGAVFPGINIAPGFADTEDARALVGEFLTR
jgi:nuclear RNA export factor